MTGNQAEPLIITPAHLRHLLACERRAWLDANGDKADQAALPAEVTNRLDYGVAHEQAVQDATTGAVTKFPAASWAEAVTITRDLIARGVAVLIGARLEAAFTLPGIDRPLVLRGAPDRLHRRGNGRYLPIEVKSYQKIGDADRLQMDCYLFMLRMMGVSAGDRGLFWLGRDADDQPLQRFPHQYAPQRLKAALLQAAQIMTAAAPAPHISKVCQGCPWLSACRRQPEVTHDIALLPGLHHSARAALPASGMTTLAHIAASTPEQLRTVPGIKTSADAHHAAARAWVSESPVWYAAPDPRSAQRGAYFDIETHPDTGTAWCIGWAHDGEPVQIAIAAHARASGRLTLPGGQVVHLLPDSDAIWRAFAEDMGTRAAAIYHWTGFDAGVMRQTAPPDVTAALDTRLHDLHASVNRAVRLPTFGSSIKVVAAYLGFSWSGYSGYEPAYADYLAWLRYGRADLLTQACAYQRDDVLALQVVWRWMRDAQG